MFYKKKYKQLLKDVKDGEFVVEEAMKKMMTVRDVAVENLKMCQEQYQILFKDYNAQKGIIETIREIREDRAFTGKQGKEIDKLIG